MIKVLTKGQQFHTQSDDSHSIQATNFWHLYWDVAWFGVLFGSTISFLAVFAARQGAAGWQLGFLTAGPALVNILATLPAGRWLEKRSLGPAVTKAALLHRLGYLALVPLPLLLPASMQVWALLLLSLLMAVPGTALAVGFNAVLAAAVPEEFRGRVVGRRNALLAAANMLSFIGSGWLLTNLDFETGYVVVFGLGAVGAAMSTYHLYRLRLPADPQFQIRPVQDRAQPGRTIGFAGVSPHRLTVGLRLWLQWPRQTSSFSAVSNRYRWMMLAYFLFHFAQFLPGALFPIFWVRDVSLTDAEIGWINGLFYLAMLVASPWLGPLTSRFGNYRLNVTGAVLLGIYPLLTALSTDVWLLIVANILGGVVWAILSGALVNRLLEFIPADQRSPHLALYNLVLNIATLGGIMLGPLLSDLMGMREALFLIFGLRVVSGLALKRWG